MNLVIRIMILLMFVWVILLQAQVSASYRMLYTKSNVTDKNVMDLARLIADLSASTVGLAKTVSDLSHKE